MAKGDYGHVTIEIERNSGNMIYSPALLRVRREDEIVWECDSPFAIQFTGASPCVGADYRSGANQEDKRRVRTDAQPGAYPYACAVYAYSQVYMDAACPVIIIE